jgi:flagellar assembly protein FliH
MSPSARRLASDVAIERFAWQAAPVAGRVVPLLRRSEHPAPAAAAAPAMRDLPSPSAERLEAAEREAFARGYAEGERTGEAAARARVDAMLQRLAETVAGIADLREGVLRRSERELVRLALAMAQRVVRREVDIDRELLSVMARTAIDRLGENAVATIHLHPADCDAVREHGGADASGLDVVADVNVPRGGCLIRSALGTIDAGIDAQMRELARALLGDETGQEEPDGLPADV